MNAIQIPEIKSLIWTELSNKALGSLTNDSDITELATQIINYSQVSKDWQTAFKDTLNSIKKLQIEKQYLNDTYLNIEKVPLVKTLDGSCVFDGSPLLFRVLYHTSEEKPLNLYKLQDICKLFPNAVNSKHLSFEEDFGCGSYVNMATNVTLLKFACQLYTTRHFPLEVVKTLIKDGANDDIDALIKDFSEMGKFSILYSNLYPEQAKRFNELNNLLTSIRIVSNL